MTKRSLFGQTLLLLRQEQGLSQVELANLLNEQRQQQGNAKKVTKQHIFKLENDPHYRGTDKMVEEIVTALKLTRGDKLWELKQIYENAGLTFDRVMAIGRGDSSIGKDEIETLADPIDQLTYSFAKFLAEGQSEEAVEQARQALNLWSHSPNGLQDKHNKTRILTNLGTALLAFSQDGRHQKIKQNEALDEAIQHFKQALELESNNPFVIVQLGHAYFTLANSFSQKTLSNPNWREAFDYFYRSIRFFNPASDMDLPKLQEASFYLGYCAAVLGELDVGHYTVNLSLFLARELSPLGFYLKACLMAQELKDNPNIELQEIIKYIHRAIILDKQLKEEVISEPLFEHLKSRKAYQHFLKQVLKIRGLKT